MRNETLLIGRLTASERRSLRALSTPERVGFRASHKERLIDIGLVELVEDELYLTQAGRHVLELVGGWSTIGTGQIFIETDSIDAAT